MSPAGPLILEFGSRSGSWFALSLFTMIFAILGWGVAREVRRRSYGAARIAGRVLGLALFLGPVLLVYVSSLGGFYEAEVDGPTLRLHYLFPGDVSEIPLSDVSARARPWARGRWRLVVTTEAGVEYESATWHRASIEESLARLNTVLPRR
jgi:hypothetical protein